MGEQFDRVAIIAGTSEFIVLETQVMSPDAHGNGPRGGVLTLKEGWISVTGTGEARLWSGEQGSGGDFPPRLTLSDAKGKLNVEIAAHDNPTPNASQASVYLEGVSGMLSIKDEHGDEHTLLEGAKGNLWLGGKTGDGDVLLFQSEEKSNRETGHATVHLNGGAGELILRTKKGKNTYRTTVQIEGSDGKITLSEASGDTHARLENGNLWLGGPDADGDVVLFKRGEKSNQSTSHATVHIDGDEANLIMRNKDGQTHCLLEGDIGNLWLGGMKGDGDILLFASGEEDNKNTEKATIHLDGGSGDIILRNADCAEDFDVDVPSDVEPGTVMVIGASGRLAPSQAAYDRRVAGVVSGAGACKPGIVLDRQRERDARFPIALVGKVYCKVDATRAPIDVGDLLTTSGTSGHAMKADDPARAFGAVIGKALAPLPEGRGLLPILVALN